MLTADDVFFKSMNPTDMIILPLIVDREEALRAYDGGFGATNPFAGVDPKMEFDWEAISKNSYRITVHNLTRGEYGIVFRLSKVSVFNYSSIFAFTFPENPKEDYIITE